MSRDVGSGLSPLEVVSGLVFGQDERAPSVPRLRRPMDPLVALENAIRPTLCRPPCLVSFSGGRDSSAVLAVATALARREGLELPVPATNRFSVVESAEESEWQERVVRHLGLGDWWKLAHTDELDCVGPVAQRVLSRHGLLWPFNSHFHAPLLERARGGSLLSGLGGDEAFSPSQWERAHQVVTGAVQPRPRDVLRVGFALSPRAVRGRVLRRRMPRAVLTWLRPPARQAVTRLWASEAADEPLRWTSRFRWLRRLRHMEVGIRSLDTLGADEDAVVVNPLCDLTFLAALAALPRSRRFRSRTEAMRTFFGELLPERVLSRQSKASFDAAFWNRHSQRFVETWSGEGVDVELVDDDVLRRLWQSPEPDPRSFLLLQAAWLERHSLGESREQQLDRTIEREPRARPS